MGQIPKGLEAANFLQRTAFIALFAALIAAGAFVAIPVGPVPVVLQNFFAVLSGLVLGPLMGGAAAALYLLAGLLGLPVFAGGTGGIARFAGPTGGFLIGYFLAAVTAVLVAGRPDLKAPRLRLIGAAIAGSLVLYVPGLAWLKLSRKLDWPGAVMAGFVPFIIGDILKGIAAVIIAPRLRRTAAGFLNGKK
jgi:biotin transport system substrate-specific component